MQLKTIVSIGLCSWLVAGSLWGQQVSVSFPDITSKEINLYYFSGAHADTLTATLDGQGKALFTVPQKDYRGMIVLGNTEAGLVELILAEPLLKVACQGATLNIETAECIQSAENDYLKWIFSTQSRHIRQLAWLQQGETFYDGMDSTLVAALENVKIQTQQAIDRSQSENHQSPLFAARYYEAADFMNRLYEADQYAYSQYYQAIKAEMEKAEMVPAMYRSGNMWLQMHNIYISLFNRAEGLVNKHLLYAKSIMNTLQHLQPPCYEAYLAGSITETERFGWLDSRDTILSRVMEANPRFKTGIPSLKLSLNAFLMRSQQIAPEIVGLAAQKGVTKTIVAFHDTDCNTCVNEMNTLVRRYGTLKKNKIRVVSIAADKNPAHFEAGTRDFPWADRLCDLQGFEGVNFTAFGVVATPTFFVINKDGKIEKEYNSANELMDELE